MQHTKDKTVDHLSEEKLYQKSLKDVRESFKTANVLSKKVAECKIVSWDANFGVSNAHYVMSIGSERFPVQFAYKDDLIDDLELNSTTLYVTIYEIEYNNIRRTLASTVYHTKEEAADEINSYNCEFKFSMNEKTSRYNKESFKNQEYVARSLKGKSNIASAYLSELKQTPKGTFSVISSLIGFSLASSFTILYLTRTSLVFENILGDILAFVMLCVITFLPLFVLCIAISHADGYTCVDIPEDVLETHTVEIDDSENVLDEMDSYESVKCSITRNEDGIKFTSVDELDCEWVYPRNDNGLLSDEGQEFVDSVSSVDNYCIFTVVDSVSDDDKFVSTNGEWKMLKDN